MKAQQRLTALRGLPSTLKMTIQTIEGGVMIKTLAAIPTLEFKSDNPGGDWLKGEQAYNRKQGKNRHGAPVRFGPTTGYWSRNVMLPVSLLVSIKGLSGEQDNVRQENLDWLDQHMKKHHRLPLIDTKSKRHYAPFIMVWQDGTAWVSEGNHRIMAAARQGFTYLPIELRYFSGGEQANHALSPEKVKEFDGQALAQGFTLTNYGPRKEASLTINDPKSFGFKKQLIQEVKRGKGKGKIVKRLGDIDIWLYKTPDEKVASAWQGDNFVGGIVAPQSHYHNMFKLHQMYVEEAYRGKGVAPELMKAVVTEPTLIDELMSMGFTKSLKHYFDEGKMIAFDTETEKGVKVLQYYPKVVLENGMEFEWGKITHSRRHDDFLLCIRP